MILMTENSLVADVCPSAVNEYSAPLDANLSTFTFSSKPDMQPLKLETKCRHKKRRTGKKHCFFY
jgi:hypothetical protein